jgi:hypothetical protein
MMSEPSTSPLADDGDDVLCIACGYSLRGLSAEGDCPECGLPVEKSLRGNRLADADPGWLKRIARGQAWLSIGVSILSWTMSVGLIVLILLPIAILAVSQPNARFLGIVFSTGWILAAVLLGGGFIASCIGGFLVTTLDPRESLRESPTASRALARWSLCAACGIIIVGSTLNTIGPLASAWWLQAMIIASLTIAMALGIHSLFRWLTALALRIPSSELRIRTVALRKRLVWLIALMGALYCVAIIARAVQTPPPAGGRTTLMRVASCTNAILVLFMVFAIVRASALMREYHQRFTRLIAQNAR